jgi:hypothetical protein
LRYVPVYLWLLVYLQLIMKASAILSWTFNDLLNFEPLPRAIHLCVMYSMLMYHYKTKYLVMSSLFTTSLFRYQNLLPTVIHSVKKTYRNTMCILSPSPLFSICANSLRSFCFEYILQISFVLFHFSLGFQLLFMGKEEGNFKC